MHGVPRKGLWLGLQIECIESGPRQYCGFWNLEIEPAVNEEIENLRRLSTCLAVLVLRYHRRILRQPRSSATPRLGTYPADAPLAEGNQG